MEDNNMNLSISDKQIGKIINTGIERSITLRNL
jgi:hypothetical protein